MNSINLIIGLGLLAFVVLAGGTIAAIELIPYLRWRRSERRIVSPQHPAVVGRHRR